MGFKIHVRENLIPEHHQRFSFFVIWEVYFSLSMTTNFVYKTQQKIEMTHFSSWYIIIFVPEKKICKKHFILRKQHWWNSSTIHFGSQYCGQVKQIVKKPETLQKATLQSATILSPRQAEHGKWKDLWSSQGDFEIYWAWTVGKRIKIFPASRGPFSIVLAELMGVRKRDLCPGSKQTLIQPSTFCNSCGNKKIARHSHFKACYTRQRDKLQEKLPGVMAPLLNGAIKGWTDHIPFCSILFCFSL